MGPRVRLCPTRKCPTVPTTSALWVLRTVLCSPRAFPSLTEKEDEKLAGLRKESLPEFVLATLIFLLIIAGGAALWTILVAAMRLDN